MQVSLRGERKFPPKRISGAVRGCRRAVSRLIPGVLFGVLVGVHPAFAAPPGAVISNQAVVTFYNAGGAAATALSNEVEVVTAVRRSPSTAVFTRIISQSGDFRESTGPAICVQGDALAAMPNPIGPGGSAIDPGNLQNLMQTSSYNLGETLFVRLDDADQNTDYASIETVIVVVENSLSGDVETLRLRETGPDSGVFAGYIGSESGSAVSADCVLQGATNTTATLRYTDAEDSGDSSVATAVLDPVGIVFDSRTGEPVDGIGLQLVDAVSGLPAIVYGSDGVSEFPSSITSGSAVTDSGGMTYDFEVGEFRFPSVPAGEYRLVALPSGAYSAPSAVSQSDLQLLPEAPFALGPLSFGNIFVHAGNGPFAFDYPVDPQQSSLYLSKSTTTAIAAPGDFVRYELSLENTSSSDSAEAVTILDRLPPGTRYVAGTATRNGAAIDDPSIEPATMVLRFPIGLLADGARADIAYVVEIVGGARGGELINTAIAQADGGIVSNESEARIRLREDLFRSTGTLIGRVVEGGCAQATFGEDRGVHGVRVYLEDGRYAVSDEGGRFHFEGLRPGTHVAQLDRGTVPDYFELAGCDSQARFAGSGDSQFVDLSPGSLSRADFYLRRKLAPEGRVDIALSNTGTNGSDEVVYEVVLKGSGNIPISNLRAQVVLPDGMRYVPGSMRADGVASIAPRIMGQSLNLEFGDPDTAPNTEWRKSVHFAATIDSEVAGDLLTRAIGRFDSPVEENQQTPVAETLIRREAATWDNAGYVLHLQFGVLSADLSAGDRDMLDALIASWQGVRDVRITAVGHSDSTDIAPQNRGRFADNYILSRARASAAANYLALALNLPSKSIQVEGRGPDDPVASNDSAAGRSRNRRVELILGGRRPGKQSFLSVARPSSGTLIAETRGLPPGVAAATQQMLDEQALADHLLPPEQLEAHINSHAPGIGWVLPETDFRPAIPATRISIRHGLEQTVALFVNGLEVNPLNFESTEINTARTVAVSRWVGVDLLEGSNQIVADVIGANGRVVDRLTRTVHYSGAAVRGELVAESSRLVADGRTRPVLAIRLYDRFGQPARHSTVGAYSIDAPYRPWWAVQNDRENKLVHVNNREPLYTIGDDGLAFIELEPTTHSGMANLRLRFGQRREQELGAWLRPAPRDWILVGFGEGTVGYNTLRDNSVSAVQAGHDEGYFDDGRVAFFAKGQIKGEYLLTLAYDSARDRNEARRQFRTEVDPGEYYTLYADNTEQRFEAPSQRKLYVKLERNQFNALFGDFSTGLTTTDLARYERRFNGFKSEYHGAHAGYSMFASRNDQAFVRDEIQGDGTSGLYRLSATPIIGNSETLRLEVRDRFDSARVVSTRSLTRFLDYDLDPIDGTVFFKKPVPSRDENFDLVYIIAEYETTGAVNDDIVAGGRVAVHSDDKTVEFGLTHVTEQRGVDPGNMNGVDMRWRVRDETLVRAEYAESRRDDAGVRQRGAARSISVEHRGEKLELRAQYREVEQTFGLGQQAAAEKGIRKYGLEGRLAMRADLALQAQAVLQENLETGAERTLAQADVEYRGDRTSATVGVTHAQDRFTDGVRQTSDIVNAGVSRRLFDSALTVRANGSLGVGGDPQNADYLSSYVFGFDYELLPEVDLFLEYENAEGADIEAEMSRVGVRASPWSRAQFSSSVTNEMSEFGPRLFANLGLIQGVQVNERWVVDLGFDQTRTLADPALRTFDPDRERAFGSYRDDFAAAYVSSLFQSERWSVNSRLEYRYSDNEKRLSLLTGWYREPRLGHGMSAGLSVYRSERPDGADTRQAELRMGWAYRPADSRWTVLHRVDLQAEDSKLPGVDQRVVRLINNLNANRRITANSQLALQYAFKYVESDFQSLAVSGYTDLAGIDVRRGFRGRWEAGVHASAYNSHNSGIVDYGVGVDVGYNLADSMWVSVGYNIEGFHDADFAAARYTAAGPYLTVTVRAHQEHLRRIAGR